MQALEASVVAADAAVVEAQAMLADAEASFAAKSVSTPKKSSKKKKSYYADPDEVENENENDHVIQDAAAASAEGSIEDLRAHVAMLDANARAARQRLESMVEALASQPLSGSGDSSSSKKGPRQNRHKQENQEHHYCFFVKCFIHGQYPDIYVPKSNIYKCKVYVFDTEINRINQE